MTLSHSRLIRSFLVAACCTAAAACGGDDGDPAPTNDGTVPYLNGVAPVGGAMGQPSSMLGQPAVGSPATSEPVDSQVGAMGQVSMDLGGGGTAPTAASVSFSADLGELFVNKCSGCHSFWRTNDEAAYIRAFDLDEVILAAVRGDFTTSYALDLPIMPLGCGDGVGQGSCLSQVEVDLIAAWVAADSPM